MKKNTLFSYWLVYINIHKCNCLYLFKGRGNIAELHVKDRENEGIFMHFTGQCLNTFILNFIYH